MFHFFLRLPSSSFRLTFMKGHELACCYGVDSKKAAGVGHMGDVTFRNDIQNDCTFSQPHCHATPLAKLQPASKHFHAFFSHLNFKWKCVNHVGLDGLAQAFVQDKNECGERDLGNKNCWCCDCIIHKSANADDYSNFLLSTLASSTGRLPCLFA